MRVRYFGHSCFEVVTAGKSLLFDPFITANPLAENIDPESINPDYVLVSHAHYDHIDDAELFLKKNNAVLIANYEICSWLEQKGSYRSIKMNIGAKTDLDFGRVRMTAAYHSSTLPDGSPGGSPGGFLIESGGKRFYFAGDTGLGPYLEFIGRHWPPDISFLPISGRVALDAEDALIASGWLNSPFTIGMHYNAFPDLTINTQTAKTVFERANKTLTLLQPGETLTL